MSKKKVALGLAAILLLVVGSVWAYRSRADSQQVEKVKQLQVEAFKEGATPEQRQKNFELLHQESEKLSPDQRHEVREQMREVFERRMDEQMKTYFAMPPQARVAYLDKQIDEMEKHSKEMQAHRAQNPRNSGAGGQGGRGQASGGPAGGGGPQAGQGGGGRSMNSDDRALRRDARLDHTTAAQRAQRSSYMADLQARRLQRGLPVTPSFGGRGPR